MTACARVREAGSVADFTEAELDAWILALVTPPPGERRRDALSVFDTEITPLTTAELRTLARRFDALARYHHDEAARLARNRGKTFASRAWWADEQARIRLARSLGHDRPINSVASSAQNWASQHRALAKRCRSLAEGAQR